MAEKFDISSLGMEDFEEYIDDISTEDTTPVEPQEDPNEPIEDPEDNNIINNPDNSEDGAGDDPVDPESVADEGDNGDGSTPNSSSQPSSPLQSFASALLEEGVLSSLPDDLKLESPADLVNLMRKEIETREFADLEEDDLEYLKARRSGITREEYFTSKNVLDQLNKINDEVLESDGAVDLRINLIANDFVLKGVSKEKAVKLAKRSVELGEDIEDAKEAFKSIKSAEEQKVNDKIAKAQAEIKAQEDAEKKEFETLKNLIYDESKEVIPGLKPTKQLRDKIYDSITKVVGKDKDGNPINQVMKARSENKAEFEFKIHYLYHLTDGFKDFSVLEGAATSKAVEKFEKALNDANYVSKGGNTRYSRGTNDLDLDFLNDAVQKG